MCVRARRRWHCGKRWLVGCGTVKGGGEGPGRLPFFPFLAWPSLLTGSGRRSGSDAVFVVFTARGAGGGRKDIAVALFILLILILFVSSISITPSLLHLQSGRFIGTQGGVVVTISSRYCTRCTRGTLEKGWHCYWSLAAVLKLRGGTTDSAGGKVAAALLRKMISIICS